MSEAKNCSRCGELKPVDDFYFVSKKLGTRRGQCKPCMSEVKAAQKDPNWLPVCAGCGQERERTGPGRRLCAKCFEAKYDLERKREKNGRHLKLNPCRLCGVKRLLEDHVKGAALCAVCRSVPQHRRKRLKEFNLNPREYLSLLEAQGYKCAICHRKPRSTLHIDHRHALPMIVRGLLCPSCNTLLGAARDNRDTLRAAADYLDAPFAQTIFPGRVATLAANRNFRPITRKR